ncbi:hypothetical protein OOK36_02750 [Streptomyces sp. NBC_00365]|nr:hypothetical protein [Streptomyces sp. NBC_00365]MCX5087831.1 hypothetical protein [Streptomyces sp. NBC_00365]
MSEAAVDSGRRHWWTSESGRSTDWEFFDIDVPTPFGGPPVTP